MENDLLLFSYDVDNIRFNWIIRTKCEFFLIVSSFLSRASVFQWIVRNWTELNVNFSKYNKNESQHSISDNSRLDVTLTHPELRLCYWTSFDEGERDTALIPVGGLYIEITDILQHHQPPTKGKELNFTQPSNILSTNHKLDLNIILITL